MPVLVELAGRSIPSKLDVAAMVLRGCTVTVGGPSFCNWTDRSTGAFSNEISGRLSNDLACFSTRPVCLYQPTIEVTPIIRGYTKRNEPMSKH